jgi:hypothetical protein
MFGNRRTSLPCYKRLEVLVPAQIFEARNPNSAALSGPRIFRTISPISLRGERQEDLKTGIFLSPHFPVINFLSAWGTGLRLVLSDKKMMGRKINPCQSVASVKIRVPGARGPLGCGLLSLGRSMRQTSQSFDFYTNFANGFLNPFVPFGCGWAA